MMRKEKSILSSKQCAVALFLCFLTALTAIPSTARSQSVPEGDGAITVSWTFATHNMDGTPLTDLASAKIYYGASSSNYTHVVEVPGGVPGEKRSYKVSGLEPGASYYLNGTAYSAAGLESDFCNEIVRVALSENLPPVVNAGQDGAAVAKTPVQMQGSVSDDGIPRDGASTIAWTVVSATGEVKIDNQDQPDTFITFQRSGTHILRLTASDGELTAHDDVTFEVTIPPPRGLRVVK